MRIEHLRSPGHMRNTSIRNKGICSRVARNATSGKGGSGAARLNWSVTTNSGDGINTNKRIVQICIAS